MKSKPISFRFSENLEKALEEAKWELRKSKSQIVKEAIKEYLKINVPDIYKRYLEEKKKI